MKNQELFLNIDIDNLDIALVEKTLKENGWIIEYSNNYLTIYESKSDKKHDEYMCKKKGSTFEQAFLACIKKIKEYYIRVL